MKRNHWLIAAAYLLAGAAALTAALLTETKLDGIFFGLAGAGLGPGLVLLGQCFYLSNDKFLYLPLPFLSSWNPPKIPVPRYPILSDFSDTHLS